MLALPASEGELFLERWDFLRPWCRLLRGRLSLEGKFSELSALGDYWWLVVRLPTAATTGEVPKLREALELLALVAYVDHEAWKRLLVEQCHLALDDDEEQIDGAFFPRLLFQFDETYLKYSSLAPAALLEQFFSTSSHSSKRAPSAGYRSAIDSILALNGTATTQNAAVPWKIPFSIEVFGLRNLSPAKVTAHLNYLLTSFLEIQSSQAKGHQIKVTPAAKRSGEDSANSPQRFSHFFSYELEALKLCLGSINLSENLPAVVLKLLSAPDLNFGELQLCLQQATAVWGEAEGSASASSDRMTTGLLFSSLVHGKAIAMEQSAQGGPRSPSLHAPFTRTSRVDSVVMHCGQVEPWAAAALSSSVAESRGITKLTLDGYINGTTDTLEVQTWKWQWLAYALLRPASRSSIKHLVITKARISEADVTAITNVCKANWPELETDLTAGSVEKLNLFRVRVPKGTLIRLYTLAAHSRDEICLTIEAAQDFECNALDVGDNQSDWIDVVVPGYGRGCVRQADVEVIDEPTLASGEEEHSGLESLYLALDQEIAEGADSDALLGLLKLVGTSLRSLSLQSEQILNVDIARIAELCPKLQLLFLDNVQIDLDALLAEMNNRTLALSSLMLADMRIPNEQMKRLTLSLADPASPVSHQLKELCIIPDNEEFPATEESLKCFLEVLGINRHLEYLDLRVQPELYDRYFSRFRAFHREVLPVEKEKLPLVCKLAFLSVLHPTDDPASTLWMDHHVVSLVFAFAGTCVNRTVCLRCDH